jgi:hypothetical protein
MHTTFSLENMNGRDHEEDIGGDGKITLEWMLKGLGGGECVDWMYVAQHRD